MTIQELRKLGKDKLIENNIEEADIKTDLLLQYVLDKNKVELIINSKDEVKKDVEERLFGYITDVIHGKPVQYITNKQEFMNLNFYVDENVLIPQPDTEILVEETVKIIYEYSNKLNKSKIKLLDLCTGSGAIAIAISQYFKDKVKNNEINLEIYASDISTKAVEVAKKNAENNNAAINFILSDMFENIKEDNFDIIVSNPPYIETETILSLSKEVQKEPHLALDGGKDGLDFYRIIANEAYQHIKNNGFVLLEIGYNQKEKVTSLLKQCNKYVDLECVKDLNSKDRVIKGRVDNQEKCN